jgi:hypothetical protein
MRSEDDRPTAYIPAVRLRPEDQGLRQADPCLLWLRLSVAATAGVAAAVLIVAVALLSRPAAAPALAPITHICASRHGRHVHAWLPVSGKCPHGKLTEITLP